MANERLNHWLQIIANLGIVGGLVLVGVQVKQNSDLLKMQLLYEESQRSMTIENLVVGEDAARVWAKSLTDTGNLTLDERRVLEAMLWSYTENLRATHMLSELGLLRNEEWRLRVMADSAFYLANPYARAWWANYTAEPELPQELVDAVNKRLAAAPYDFTSGYMEAITTKLGEQANSHQQRTAPHMADDSPEAAIQAARARFNLAIEKQQPEGMANLFAPGYELVSGRGDRVQGPDAQLEMWRETFSLDPTFNCQRTPEQIDVNADWGLAREVGSWLCTQTVEGTPAQYNGVYAAKWQSTANSHWMLQSEVFTTLDCDGPPAACRGPDPIESSMR